MDDLGIKPAGQAGDERQTEAALEVEASITDRVARTTTITADCHRAHTVDAHYDPVEVATEQFEAEEKQRVSAIIPNSTFPMEAILRR